MSQNLKAKSMKFLLPDSKELHYQPHAAAKYTIKVYSQRFKNAENGFYQGMQPSIGVQYYYTGNYASYYGTNTFVGYRQFFAGTLATAGQGRTYRKSRPQTTFVQPKFVEVLEEKAATTDDQKLFVSKAHELVAPAETTNLAYKNAPCLMQTESATSIKAANDLNIRTLDLEPQTAVKGYLGNAKKEETNHYTQPAYNKVENVVSHKTVKSTQPISKSSRYTWTYPSFTVEYQIVESNLQLTAKLPTKLEIDKLLSQQLEIENYPIASPPQRHDIPETYETPEIVQYRSSSCLEHSLHAYNGRFKARQRVSEQKEMVRNSAKVVNGMKNDYWHGALLDCREASNYPGDSPVASSGVEILGYINVSDIQEMQTLVESLKEENARLRECDPRHLRRDIVYKQSIIENMLSQGKNQDLRKYIAQITEEIQLLKRQLVSE